MTDNIVKEFLDKYRELDNIVSKKYPSSSKENNQSPVLEDRIEFDDCRKKIEACRKARNILSHAPRMYGEYPIYPSRGMIRFVDTVIQRLQKPQTVEAIMVKYQNVLSATPDDTIRPILKKMVEKTFTHIPIVENNCVVGVFSENTLLSLLTNDEIAAIEDGDTFNSPAIKEIIQLEKHITECFKFVSRNTTVFEVKELFRQAIEKQERIGLVFVTQTGRSNEKLLGIVSPWDIPRFEID